jgi:hypothetical protein|tara:strand:+ start:684 stop:1079 length:396 start_codon:yes stop_codon:yes gene_type:complete
MNILLISDNASLNHELQNLLKEVSGGNYQIVSSTQLLENGVSGPIDVVMSDRKTWQKAYSLIKYFNVSGAFEFTPVMFVSRGRKPAQFKGRIGKKDIFVSIPTNRDAFNNALDDYKQASDQMEMTQATSQF